jgi:hypothetical protein
MLANQKSVPDRYSFNLCDPTKRSKTSELVISVGKEKSTRGVRVLAQNEPKQGHYFQKGVFSSIQPVSGLNEWFKKSEKDINHYDPAQAQNDCPFNWLFLKHFTDCGVTNSTFMQID